MFIFKYFCIFVQNMNHMDIDKKLHDDIKAYCKLNGLKMNEYINKLLRNAFNIDRYGISPFSNKKVDIIKEEKPLTPNETLISNEKKEEGVKEEIKTSENENDEYKVVKINGNKRKLK